MMVSLKKRPTNSSVAASTTETDDDFAASTFGNDLPLPKLIVFDLDYTLWPFWADTHPCPPIKAKDNGSYCVDKYGESFSFYADVPAILLHLHSLGLPVAACSRTHAPDVARDLLKQLTLPATPSMSSKPIKRAIDFFDYLQIFPGSKVKHFEKLHKQTGIEYSDMLFFDDEKRNREVEELDVVFYEVTDGVDKSVIEQGIQEWRKRKARIDSS